MSWAGKVETLTLVWNGGWCQAKCSWSRGLIESWNGIVESWNFWVGSPLIWRPFLISLNDSVILLNGRRLLLIMISPRHCLSEEFSGHLIPFSPNIPLFPCIICNKQALHFGCLALSRLGFLFNSGNPWELLLSYGTVLPSFGVFDCWVGQPLEYFGFLRDPETSFSVTEFDHLLWHSGFVWPSSFPIGSEEQLICWNAGCYPEGSQNIHICKNLSLNIPITPRLRVRNHIRMHCS